MNRCVALLGLALLLAAPARAQAPEEPAAEKQRFGVSIDRSKPLSISSDELEVVRTDGLRRLLFSRNVVVEQADVRIRTDQMEAFYPKGASQPERLIAKGRVVVTQGEREVRCQRATYDRAAQTLICSGNAELRDGEDRARGDVIEFDLANETVVVTGGAAVVLHPRPEDQVEPEAPEAPNG